MMSQLKVRMDGDASGAVRAMGDMERGQTRLQGALRVSTREATTLGDRLRQLGGTVMTGALHRVGAMLTDMILNPLRLGIKLVGELIGAIGRLATQQVGRGMQLFREAGVGTLGRSQLSGGQQAGFQRMLDEVSRRTGMRGIQGAGNRALELSGGNMGRARDLLMLAADVGAARGMDPSAVVEGLGRARSQGDVSGLMGLGLGDAELELFMQRRQRVHQTRGVQGAYGNLLGSGGAMVGADALNGTPYGSVVEMEARRRAAAEASVMAETRLRSLYGGAAERAAGLEPFGVLDRTLDPARRTIGGAVVGYQQQLAGRLMPAAQRVNAAVAGSDPGALAQAFGGQVASGEMGKLLAEAFRGSDAKAAFVELLRSGSEAVGALFTLGMNKALDAVAERSTVLNALLGLKTRDERLAVNEPDAALAALANSGTREGLRAHAQIAQGLADAESFGYENANPYVDRQRADAFRRGTGYWTQRALVAAKQLVGFVPERTGADPDVERLSGAVGRVGSAVGRGVTAAEDVVLRGANAAASIAESAAMDARLTQAQWRMQPAGGVM